jgi:hypothetical protein
VNAAEAMGARAPSREWSDGVFSIAGSRQRRGISGATEAPDRCSEKRLLLELLTQRALESAPADEAAGEGEEGFVDLCSAVVADEESAALVQPGEGAFDDPALAAQARAVLGLAARDHGLDATRPQLTAIAAVVVAAVGDESSGSSSWAADADGPCRLGSGRSRRPFFRLDLTRVRDRPRPVELATGVQLREQQRVQPLPHTRLLPGPQPTPASHPAAESQLLRKVLPGDSGVQHEVAFGIGTRTVSGTVSRQRRHRGHKARAGIRPVASTSTRARCSQRSSCTERTWPGGWRRPPGCPFTPWCANLRRRVGFPSVDRSSRSLSARSPRRTRLRLRRDFFERNCPRNEESLSRFSSLSFKAHLSLSSFCPFPSGW